MGRGDLQFKISSFNKVDLAIRKKKNMIKPGVLMCD